jgi:hypothetical protein
MVIVADRYLCVFGGKGPSGLLNDLWLFDTGKYWCHIFEQKQKTIFHFPI